MKAISKQSVEMGFNYVGTRVLKRRTQIVKSVILYSPLIETMACVTHY